MDIIIAARALHVLGLVVWIGGLWMVTTVVLPGIRKGDFGPDKHVAFHQIERRFVWHARAAVVLVGLTGFYMTSALELWARFAGPHFWWMHAMVGVWSLFALLLFVGEPLVLHRLFPAWSRNSPDRTFAWFHWMHIVLLLLALATVLGASAGAHGWSF